MYTRSDDKISFTTLCRFLSSAAPPPPPPPPGDSAIATERSSMDWAPRSETSTWSEVNPMDPGRQPFGPPSSARTGPRTSRRDTLFGDGDDDDSDPDAGESGGDVCAGGGGSGASGRGLDPTGGLRADMARRGEAVGGAAGPAPAAA